MKCAVNELRERTGSVVGRLPWIVLASHNKSVPLGKWGLWQFKGFFGNIFFTNPFMALVGKRIFKTPPVFGHADQLALRVNKNRPAPGAMSSTAIQAAVIR